MTERTRRHEVTVIPDALRTWRLERGLTQAGLAARVGCSEGLVALAEVGKRNLSRASADAFATALQVPTSAIARINFEPDADSGAA